MPQVYDKKLQLAEEEELSSRQKAAILMVEDTFV
jgi:hypothetical protein